MLKVPESSLDELEKDYPGIREQIAQFESISLESCPHCGGKEVARIIVGVLGRAIAMVTATSNCHLLPDGEPGMNWYCRDCQRLFA